MNFKELKEQENQYIMQTYGRFDQAFDHGQGVYLYDLDGNAFLDLTSGIGVNCLGHNHPALTEALSRQIGKVMETSNLFYTEPMVHAARKLVEASGMDKVFFANSGAEANEGAIKCARKYSFDKYGKGRDKIVTLINSFHGRTITTLEATGQDHYHNHFFPFTQGFVYVPANDLEALKAACDEKTCAIMMELIQGEGGVLPLDEEYVQEAARFAQENDLLLIIDEVQTGIGRTGALFAFQNYGIQPDIVTMAKGLGGGVPIGGFLTSKKTASVLGKGDHGSTFGANPLACTAANTVLDVVNTPEFLEEVKAKGEYFRNKLASIQSRDIEQVRGMGLMNGVLVDPAKVSDYIEALRKEGVLVLKAGKNTIRLLPPLIIGYEQLDQAVEAFRKVFEDEASA